MRKAIILLLVASMLSLASCGNKSVDTTTGADGSSNAQTSSVVSADVSSVVSEVVSSELVSSEDSVSSVASENTKSTKTKATKTKNTSSEKIKFSSKAERIISGFNALTPRFKVSPVKSPIKNNPAIINAGKEISISADTQSLSMNKNEFNKHKKNIEFYLKDNIVYDGNKNWEKIDDGLNAYYFYYLGEIDTYKLFVMDIMPDGSLTRPSSYNRIAGYQFMVSPFIFRCSLDENCDKYGNSKTTLKDILHYSGIVLEKEGKYYTMEDLYLDNVISVETIGKIYNALPKGMQMGMFDDYKDAYNLRAHKFISNSSLFVNYTEINKGAADFISYYDKDGKFHVVYADD